MSSPSRRMVPALTGRSPDNRLRVVVLPAPLGPIIAKISPRSTSNDSSLTAAKPPKLRPIPRAVRRLSGIAVPLFRGWGLGGCWPAGGALVTGCAPVGQLPDETHQAARHEQDRDDEHNTVGHQVAV